ncbi:acyl-CoA dehydrogenase family protein [Piscinibacter sp.]|uniref:acyl-CoA dehydrogenase family protein n=1 Tax=Piscinibacter sp. TaxID=1903157 RepID=UPI002589327D|nr:acyl-CoA dehydrogenase family protein [Piscinibacter sp.]
MLGQVSDNPWQSGAFDPGESDAAGILTCAAPTPCGGWRLSGPKHVISDGAVSDFYIVSAMTGAPDAAKKGISRLLVDKGLPGFALGKDQRRWMRRIGQPIEDFQMVQQMLADSVIEVDAARLTVLHPAWLIDQAAETLGRVVDRAVQVFDGMGFAKDLLIERRCRDARIHRIVDGTSELHRGIIARGPRRRDAALFDVDR